MKVAHIAPLLFALAICGPAQAAQTGQNVSGTVRNGGTQTPVAGVKVTLLALQGGMKPVGDTSSDDAGRYRFSEPPSVAGPFLVQAEYQGVPYFATVAAGQSETNVDVYPASNDESRIHLDVEVLVVQPDNGQLAVVDEYRVENTTSPRTTLYREGGLFRFRLPEGAQLDGTRVVAPDGLPVERAANPAGANLYRVDAPLRPGETKVQVSYRLPYAKSAATLSVKTIYPTEHYEIYVPAPMTFTGEAFTKVGAQDGYTVYGAPTEAIASTLVYGFAGTAPMPAAAGEAAAPADAAPAPTAPTGPTPSRTWIEKNALFLATLLLLGAAGGFGWVFRHSAAGGAPGLAAPSAPPSAIGREAEIARLKDDLFLLEVQRHTGRLSEAEHLRLRAELDARMDALSGK